MTITPHFSKEDKNRCCFPFDCYEKPGYDNIWEFIRHDPDFTTLFHATRLQLNFRIPFFKNLDQRVLKHVFKRFFHRKTPLTVLFLNEVCQRTFKTCFYPLKHSALRTYFLTGSTPEPVLTETGGELFFNKIKSHSSLTHLGLVNGIMNSAGLSKLGTLLETTERLSNLTIMCHSGDDPNAEKFFFTSLSLNSTLSNLSLINFHYLRLHSKILAAYVAHSVVLTKLDLRLSYLGDRTGGFLAESLRLNDTLLKLDLRHNNFTKITAQAFSEALKVNSRLKTLRIDHNPLESKGGINLLKIFKHNTSLSTLTIAATQLTKEIIPVISSYLESNFSVKKLNVVSNTTQSEIEPLIQEAITPYINRNKVQRTLLFQLLFKTVCSDNQISTGSSSSTEVISPIQRTPRVKRKMLGAPKLDINQARIQIIRNHYE
jgi:hypothetical protein